MLLENITGAEDVRKLSLKEQKILAKEVRRFIIEKMSDNGGHLASNLGVVELTIALFHTLNLPKDKIVWDVGHQCYTHKILSGRRDDFALLRKFKGISGFPKREESPYDSFNTGHSSTSISAALGIAEGRDILGEDYTVLAVIGDGALTGGMAYEALNNASKMKKNFIIILNDNEMSIAKNVGGMSTYLNGIRSHKGYTRFKENLASGLGKIPLVGNHLVERLKNTKNSIKQLLVPGMLFENMGLTYLGPVDGHNLHALEQVIHEAKRIDHAVLVHVVTKKGKGYVPAEQNPSAFHGVGPFHIATGKSKKESSEKSYTDIFAESLIKEGKDNKKIVAITAAMPDGTGLDKFEKLFPKRFFDVGIAEAHAVTSAAGLASAGLKPVFAVYSSFLQRAYDQLVHDVCLQKLSEYDGYGSEEREGTCRNAAFCLAVSGADCDSLPEGDSLPRIFRKTGADRVRKGGDINRRTGGNSASCSWLHGFDRRAYRRKDGEKGCEIKPRKCPFCKADRYGYPGLAF